MSGISMTPSPIMPRSISRSVVGTSQSQTWKASKRFSPRALDLRLHSRIPPHMVYIDRDPSPSPSSSHRSLAWPKVLTQARSAAYIGCSGSIASGTPQPRAYLALRRCRREPARARRRVLRPGRKPAHHHHQTFRSGAASSIARRLSSIAARRPCRSAAGNMPPRQKPVT